MWIQKVHRGGITHLAYSSDGGTLYVADTSGWLGAWDTQTRTTMPTPHFDAQRRWSVRDLYPFDDGRLVVRTDRFTLLARDGTVLTVTDPPPRNYACTRIRPDGRVFYIEEEHRVGCRDLNTGTQLAGFTVPPVAGMSTFPTSFDFAPDGRSIAVIYDNVGPTLLFEIGPGYELRDPVRVGPGGYGFRARFSPDGNTIVLAPTVYGRLNIWDVPLRADRTDKAFCKEAGGVFAFNLVLPVFAALNVDRVLTLFNLETGEAIRSLDFALGTRVQCVCFAPDGLTCAVGGSNKQFAVFDVDV